jgi:NADH-quinone oxidoreductase subunit M
VTTATTASLVLVATPCLAAAIGVPLRNKPQELKGWLLLASILTLGTTLWASGTLPADAAGVPLLSLLPVAAFATLLGQPEHRSLGTAWLVTVLMLGLGLGVLACEARLSLFFFLLLLALVGVMLLLSRDRVGSDAQWGLATAGLGMLGLLVTMTMGPPMSSAAFLVSCAVALPLLPFHKGYVAALNGLPGNLPAFLALLLPTIGFHGLVTVLPELPSVPAEGAAVLALAGMAYGSLKALAQSRAASVVAYGSLAFFSILWWYLVTTRTAPPQSVVYLSAVGLATSGLLLAWFALRARYGEIGLRSISGLAEPMPRFAVALSLLAIAALGLPPFGVFAGFLGMLVAPSFALSGALVIVLITWLAASWYLFDFAQGLLFGRPRPERRYQDLGTPEMASLIIVLTLLVALGVVPARFFASEPGAAPDRHRTIGTGEGASPGKEPVAAGSRLGG